MSSSKEELPAGPETAGAMPAVPKVEVEGQGAFREVHRTTVRHAEILRMLAQSEGLPALPKILMRLEALMLLDEETRKRSKITDLDLAKAKAVYGVAHAFSTIQEHNEGGFASMALLFPFEAAEEEELGLRSWFHFPDDLLKDRASTWTPEIAAKLQTTFVYRTMPWVMEISGRVGDRMTLEEFEDAAKRF